MDRDHGLERRQAADEDPEPSGASSPSPSPSPASTPPQLASSDSPTRSPFSDSPTPTPSPTPSPTPTEPTLSSPTATPTPTESPPASTPSPSPTPEPPSSSPSPSPSPTPTTPIETPTPTPTPPSSSPTPTSSPSETPTPTSSPTQPSSSSPTPSPTQTPSPSTSSSPSPTPTTTSTPRPTTYTSSHTFTTNVVFTQTITSASRYVTTNTGTGGQVQTLTAFVPFVQVTSVQTVSVVPTQVVGNPNLNRGGTSNNGSSRFMNNKGAVAGVFIIVGLGIIGAFVAGGLLFVKWRRRKRELQDQFEDELQMGSDFGDHGIEYHDHLNSLTVPELQARDQVLYADLDDHHHKQVPQEKLSYGYFNEHPTPNLHQEQVWAPFQQEQTWSGVNPHAVSPVNLLAGYVNRTPELADRNTPQYHSLSSSHVPPEAVSASLESAQAFDRASTPSANLLVGYHDFDQQHLSMDQSPKRLSDQTSEAQQHAQVFSGEIPHRDTMTAEEWSLYVATHQAPRPTSATMGGEEADPRLEPSALLGYLQHPAKNEHQDEQDDEEQSLRDDTDYSRRILKLRNPDGNDDDEEEEGE